MFANGKYSFRFGGYAMSAAIQHHLVGVGWMRLAPAPHDGEQTIEGEHISAIQQLDGSSPEFESNRYSLKGAMTVKNNFAVAAIRFQEDPSAMDPQVLDAVFHLVPAGPDRMWLISTSTWIVSSGNALADEIVSGEAIRIGD